MTIKDAPNLNILWSNLIVEELIRNGIADFCLSPGARNSPLAIAVACNKKAKPIVHFDERGAAFYALGLTAASGKPSVLISTSGTATANYLPAIIEASKKKLPLIILTADRPPELRLTGSNQTIDQVGIYGPYVRFQFDMPTPTKEIPLSFILTTIDQAIYRAKGTPRGPIHINCMFREPLDAQTKEKGIAPLLKQIDPWIKGSSVYTQYTFANKSLSKDQISEIASTINSMRNGIIVVGKLSFDIQRKSVLKLAEKLNWPIFPDITSGLRLGNNHPHVIHYFDQLLKTDFLDQIDHIDGILHIGGRITSKSWYEHIDQAQPQNYIMAINHPLRNDPTHQVTMRIESHLSDFCLKLARKLPKREELSILERLKKASELIGLTIQNKDSVSDSLNEISTARIITQSAPKNSALFLSSSLPIREMDMFATHDGAPLIIGSNRGASGIDGTIASAVGFANGIKKPTTLLIGDLAFLHDINSLALVNSSEEKLIIVLLNNDGGGIFSFLPMASSKTKNISIKNYNQIFEKFFVCPHGMTMAKLAEQFNLNYVAPQTNKAFHREYRNACKSKTSTLIEVISDREENVKLHKKLQRSIVKAI